MTEGWAAYTEGELLPKQTNLYLNTGSSKHVLLQKYGMIFYQVCEILCKKWPRVALENTKIPFVLLLVFTSHMVRQHLYSL